MDVSSRFLILATSLGRHGGGLFGDGAGHVSFPIEFCWKLLPVFTLQLLKWVSVYLNRPYYILYYDSVLCLIELNRILLCILDFALEIDFSQLPVDSFGVPFDMPWSGNTFLWVWHIYRLNYRHFIEFLI